MLYSPTRQKKRTRLRGWILFSQLTNSPKAEAVRADILDRFRQHELEDTLPAADAESSTIYARTVCRTIRAESSTPNILESQAGTAWRQPRIT
jgi:hypothetical protein